MQAPIYFENGFKQLNQFIKNSKRSKFFFIVDKNTHEYCLPLLLSELGDIQDMEIVEIPEGEDAKSIEIAIQVWQTFIELGGDRQSIVINCGGGIVTDFGGFVASTFKRGIKFVNIPTSLLAMVDASVGGKTGINLSHLKNQIGTFSQPEMVIISPQFLKTLPQREMLSGFAEMLKHGLIQSKNHWENLIQIEELIPENITPLISDSVQIKKEVVEQDPTEKGLRKILNAGHTLGHALETWYLENNIEVTHGEMVALGLLLESNISMKKGVLSEQNFKEIEASFLKFYTKVELPSFNQILGLLSHDKKNKDGKIQFILLSGIGSCSSETYTVESTLISEAFNYYKLI